MALPPRTALAKAAASEDRLKLLRELRARLVDAIDEVTCVRDLEPLARRLDAVSAEVDELAGQREPSGSPADVLRERGRRGAPRARLSRTRTWSRGAPTDTARLHTSARWLRGRDNAIERR
jgi:hypothetical protein